MAKRNISSSTVRGFGTQVVAAISILPGATTLATCRETWGISSITRNGAGDYTVVVLGKPKGTIPQVTYEASDVTLFHDVKVLLQTDSTATFRISHRSVAFASVASGHALSDSFVALNVLFLGRSE